MYEPLHTNDLTDDERELAAIVRDFADEVVAPRQLRGRPHAHPSARRRRADGRDGPVRPAVPRGGRRPGRRLLRALPRDRGARPRRPVARDHARGGGEPRRHAGLPLRHRRAEGGAAARPARRARAGGVRSHRAGGGLGCRRHPHDSPSGGRRVGDQRIEAVHHQLRHRHHPLRDRDRRDRRARTAASASRRSSCRTARRASRSSRRTTRSAGTRPTRIR